MKQLIKQYKQEQKELASLIKKQKLARKPSVFKALSEEQQKEISPMWYLDQNSRNYRLKHIAYCMLRGRKYEEIEKNHKWRVWEETGNCLSSYDFRQIEKLMEIPQVEVAIPSALEAEAESCQSTRNVLSRIIDKKEKEEEEIANEKEESSEKVQAAIDSAIRKQGW